MQKQSEIPGGFERIDGHDTLDLHNPEKGIVITIIERDDLTQLLQDKYPYKVVGAKEQRGFYEGTFQSLSHAEDKVLELAEKRS